MRSCFLDEQVDKLGGKKGGERLRDTHPDLNKHVIARQVWYEHVSTHGSPGFASGDSYLPCGMLLFFGC